MNHSDKSTWTWDDFLRERMRREDTYVAKQFLQYREFGRGWV